jgi:type VI protein secretion system component VasK
MVEFEKNVWRNPKETLAQFNGDWALFRTAAAATWTGSGNRYSATWQTGGGPATVEFTFEKGAPVLAAGWLGGMNCVPEVAR